MLGMHETGPVAFRAFQGSLNNERIIALVGGKCGVPHPGGASHLRQHGCISTRYIMFQLIEISTVLFSDPELRLSMSRTAVRCCLYVFDAPKGVVERAFEQ